MNLLGWLAVLAIIGFIFGPLSPNTDKTLLTQPSAQPPAVQPPAVQQAAAQQPTAQQVVESTSLTLKDSPKNSNLHLELTGSIVEYEEMNKLFCKQVKGESLSTQEQKRLSELEDIKEEFRDKEHMSMYEINHDSDSCK